VFAQKSPHMNPPAPELRTTFSRVGIVIPGRALNIQNSRLRLVTSIRAFSAVALPSILDPAMATSMTNELKTPS
jgi:hypothetical protein